MSDDEMSLAVLRSAAMSDAADVLYAGEPVPVDYNEASDEFIAKIRPLETDRARLVVGMRHHRSTDTWRCPATRSQAAALSGVFGGRITPTELCARYVSYLFNEEAHIIAKVVDERLYGFQRTGVEYLLKAGSALLGDEMGSGKGIQAIEWMREISHYSSSPWNLVVAPSSMKYKWVEELNKWWPDAEAIAIDGSMAQRRKHIDSGRHDGPDPRVYVINYESLRTHTKLFPGQTGKALTTKQKEENDLNDICWATVVADEVHKIKGPKNLATMAVKQMGEQAEHRLALTGTPLLNSPDDLWSIMNFVAPREYGSRNQFRNRYCNMSVGFHGGYENLGFKTETMAEFDSFFQPRFLRRTKTEVLPDLPLKAAVEYRILPMVGTQLAVYNALVKDMMVSIDDRLLIAENGLSLSLRLLQAACGVPVLNDDGEVTGIDSPSNKLTAIFDMLEDSPEEPLVIYAESRKFIELVQRELIAKGHNPGMVTGTVSAQDRARDIERFQNGDTNIMLGTIGAGAEGITLTRARTIVLAQQSWSHAKNAQAIDRVHRIGQTRGVNPIVFISEGTLDVAVAMVDKDKEGRLQELVRDPAWLKKAAKGL